ncbi:M48 family metalloprotease [Nocardiopsis gilva]|uniref:M48 family metalloprotease n=1 Tax=Nocardiopsis gilva TaxID=280236 RepID=UPI001E40C0AB|nr:M48 family metalloprotease [Nocardiopsis gilva]
MSAVAGRNLRGNAAGLIAAWFNLPFALFLAAVGAIAGGLIGVVSGTIAGPGMSTRMTVLLNVLLPFPVNVEDLLPTAAFQIGGVIGGILGFLNGAWVMVWLVYSDFWRLLYEGDPSWPLAAVAGQVITALFVAVLYTFYSMTCEGWRLRITGARRPSRREAQWLIPLMAEAARRLGSPGVPVLLIDDSREPNATTWTRHIVVNQGLIDFLRYDEEAMAGILAHEIVHWKNGDAVVMAWGKGLALPLYVVYEIAVKVQQAARWGVLRFLVWAVLWSVYVTVDKIVMPLHAAEWRRCEYRADAEAKAAGYGDGLYRALAWLRQGFDGARSGWDASILATHPPTELRLEALESPHGHYPIAGTPSMVRRTPQATMVRTGPDKD